MLYVWHRTLELGHHRDPHMVSEDWPAPCCVEITENAIMCLTVSKGRAYRIFPAIRRGVCPYRMTPNN